MPHPPDRRASLQVVQVPGKGRGVVARRRFVEGEVVDHPPVLVIPGKEWPLVRQTVLERFCFIWDDGTGSVAVALGLGSLFNHSYRPNVWAEKQPGSRRMRFVALRDIEPGEEVTVNYNGDPDAPDPVGFEVR